MNSSLDLLKLRDALAQCDRHLHHLRHAMASLVPWPDTADSLGRLNDTQVQALDQFVYRFSKLQDTLGARLFPAVLAVMQEPYEEWPMVDRLHRLEKLGYLHSAENWQALRVLRNRFAHDYPDDLGLRAAALNEARQAVHTLQDAVDRARPLVG